MRQLALGVCGLLLAAAITADVIPVAYAQATVSPDGSTLAFTDTTDSLVSADGTWTFLPTTSKASATVALNGISTNGGGALLEIANGGHVYLEQADGTWYERFGSYWEKQVVGPGASSSSSSSSDSSSSSSNSSDSSSSSGSSSSSSVPPGDVSAQVEIDWTAPVLKTDGTPIAPGDIVSYEGWISTTQIPDAAAGDPDPSTPTFVLDAASLATSQTLTVKSGATLYVRIRVCGATPDTCSAMTNELSTVASAGAPALSPPTSVTVKIVIAP